MRPTVMSEPIVAEIYVHAYVIPLAASRHIHWPTGPQCRAIVRPPSTNVARAGSTATTHAPRGVSGGDEVLERGRRRLAGDERNLQPQPGGHRPASPAALREPVVMS